MNTCDKKFDKLFEELVPASGKAETWAGEIIRAMARVEYRLWNDGDIIGRDYGNETCNPAARYLRDYAGNNEITDIIENMWGMFDENEYQAEMKHLKRVVVKYVENNREKLAKANDMDMLELREDADDKWYDDDEEEY